MLRRLDLILLVRLRVVLCCFTLIFRLVPCPPFPGSKEAFSTKPSHWHCPYLASICPLKKIISTRGYLLIATLTRPARILCESLSGSPHSLHTSRSIHWFLTSKAQSCITLQVRSHLEDAHLPEIACKNPPVRILKRHGRKRNSSLLLPLRWWKMGHAAEMRRAISRALSSSLERNIAATQR